MDFLKKVYYDSYVDFETFRNKLGKKIKKERVARGLTQEDMDDGDDGVPHRTMQNIETGRSNPNSDQKSISALIIKKSAFKKI